MNTYGYNNHTIIFITFSLKFVILTLLTISVLHYFGHIEYAYTCKIDEKSDIYSFGVVLMELVTGKRPTEPEFGENKDIVQWVCSAMRNNSNTIDLVDSNISKEFKEDASKVLRIAIHCTMKISTIRPSMRMVVQMLEEVAP